MTRRSRLRPRASATGPAGSVAVPAPLQGTVVAIDVGEGDLVRPGQQIAVLESMKMEHLVTAPHGGRVTKIAAGSRRDADAGRGNPVSRARRGRRPRCRGRGGCRSRPHPSRSRRSDRAARHHARREPPGLGRAPAQDQSADGARKHRRSRRRRLLRRIRLAGDRRPTPAAQGRRTDPEHARRRPDRRRRHGQRGQVRRATPPAAW